MKYPGTNEFKQLCDLVLSEHLVIMTGSGISLDALREFDSNNVPSWPGLISDMNRDLPSPVPFPQDFLNTEPIKAATILKNLFNFSGLDFFSTLRKYVKPKEDYYSPTHRHIARLYPKGIITLNFDDLHEKAHKELKEDIESGYTKIIPFSKPGRQQMKEYLLKENSQPFILKAHGCVNDSNELIIEEEGFERILKDEPEYREFIQNLLVNNNFLFLGFGFADKDFNDFLENILNRFGGPLQNHLRIQKVNSEDENYKDELLTKFGIHTIDINEWSELPEVIEKASSTPGPRLQRILEDAINDVNTIRSKAHSELRDLSHNGKRIAYEILKIKIEENQKEDFNHSEYVYSLGCLEPKSAHLRDKIKEDIFSILDKEIRAETIAHCLATFDFYLDFKDLKRLELIQTKISEKSLKNDQEFPDNDQRIENYFNFLKTRLRATEHRKGQK